MNLGFKPKLDLASLCSGQPIDNKNKGEQTLVSRIRVIDIALPFSIATKGAIKKKLETFTPRVPSFLLAYFF